MTSTMNLPEPQFETWPLDRLLSYARNPRIERPCVMTAGVDVQKDCLEVEVVTWGRNPKMGLDGDLAIQNCHRSARSAALIQLIN